MRRTRLFVLLAVAVLFRPALAEEVVSDNWAIMTLFGKDVGHANTKVTRTDGPDGVLFVTTITSEMVMGRLGSTIDIVQTQVTKEREDGSLVHIHSRASVSRQEQISEVTFEEGKARTVLTVLGQKRETVVDCPAEAVGPYRLERMLVELPHEAGAEAKGTTFSPDTGGVTVVTYLGGGMEEVTLRDGSKQTLFKVASTMSTLPIKITTWMTKDGRALKTAIPMAGMLLEMYEATKEEALAAGKGGGLPPDVFAKTLVIPEHPAPFPRHTESALVRIKTREGTDAIPDLACATQAFVKRDGATEADLRITSLVPAEGRTGTRPLAEIPDAVRDSLAPNSMIQCDEPEIRAIANEVVGEEKDAWRAAQKLERWVHDNLTNKNMDVAFASALEVCRNREGDCTEHSVLLCALCRAAGIPSDVVMGVVYLGCVWGGHAWSRVWIDGSWYALDGTNGYGFVDALHLEFAQATLKDAAFGTELANIFLSLGTLDIDIIETTHRGTRRVLAEPGLITLDEKGYRNGSWGLTIPPLDCFEMDLQKARPTLSLRLLELEGKNSAGKKCQIEVTVYDAPYDRDVDRQASSLVAMGASIESTKVGGHAARLLLLPKKDRQTAHALVLAGDALWHFSHDRIAGDADLSTFAAFLSSIAFDD